MIETHCMAGWCDGKICVLPYQRCRWIAASCFTGTCPALCLRLVSLSACSGETALTWVYARQQVRACSRELVSGSVEVALAQVELAAVDKMCMKQQL